MPTVTVVIPAFNAAPWIAETLKSVLAQDYGNMQVIVVDDGSTDETAEIVGKFGQVQCIRQINLGAWAARNAGIRSALGEYVAFVDADDLWAPDKLSAQMELLNQTGLAWAYCDGYAFDDETKRELFKFSQVRGQHSGQVLDTLFMDNFIPSPTPVVKRSVFAQVGFFDDIPVAYDWDMWLRIAARYPIGLVNRPLAWYRVHRASMVQSKPPSALLEMDLRVIELAISRDPERLTRLRKPATAHACARVGRFAANRRETALAREYFARAIVLAPAEPTAYFYWLGTFAGRPLVAGCIWLVHWLRRVLSRASNDAVHSDRPGNAGSRCAS